jgi:hypothetical protein
MRNLHQSARRYLPALVALGGWALAAGLPAVRADVVVNTLDLPYDGSSPGDQVGAAIQIGSTPISLTSVVYNQTFTNGPLPGETFAVFSRNADGTVGTPQFTDFTLSFDSTTSDTTATATSPFTFQANTSYWLMMVEPQTPGSETIGDWDASLASTYTSAFGVTIPDTNTSYAFVSGSPIYYTRAEGLQLFQVNGTAQGAAVPEPSALALAATGGVVVLGAIRLRRRGTVTRRLRAARSRDRR